MRITYLALFLVLLAGCHSVPPRQQEQGYERSSLNPMVAEFRYPSAPEPSVASFSDTNGWAIYEAELRHAINWHWQYLLARGNSIEEPSNIKVTCSLYPDGHIGHLESSSDPPNVDLESIATEAAWHAAPFYKTPPDLKANTYRPVELRFDYRANDPIAPKKRPSVALVGMTPDEIRRIYGVPQETVVTSEGWSWFYRNHQKSFDFDHSGRLVKFSAPK